MIKTPTKAGDWITMAIALLIGVEFIKVGFPLILSGFVDISNLTGFQFAAFFGAQALMGLLLSVGVLYYVGKQLGINLGGRK